MHGERACFDFHQCRLDICEWRLSTCVLVSVDVALGVVGILCCWEKSVSKYVSFGWWMVGKVVDVMIVFLGRHSCSCLLGRRRLMSPSLKLQD